MPKCVTINHRRNQVNKGDTVTIYLDSALTNAADYTVDLVMSGESNVNMSGTQKGDLWYFTGTAQTGGDASIQIINDTGDTYTVNNYDIEKGYSDEMITLEISSTVDYGTIHYAESGTNVWTQKWYKKANVRRSPNPQVTVVGSEPDGVLIKEKVITSTRYKIDVKLTETEFNALLTAVSGTVTITDQTGETFSCDNMEISEPDWSQGNGMCEFSFVDNVSVYTLNNTDL